MVLPRLSLRQILIWADEHRKQTKLWPSLYSGPILGTDGEEWMAVDKALRHGNRGLRGGDSLACLLAGHEACAPPTPAAIHS